MSDVDSMHAWRRLRISFAGCFWRLGIVAGVASLSAIMEVAALATLVPLVTAISAVGAKVFRGEVPVLHWPVVLSAEQLLVICTLMTLGRAATQVLGAYVGARVTTGYEARQRQRLFEAFMRASWDCQSQERAGHLQGLLTTNVEVGGKTIGALANALVSVVSLLVLAGAALVVNPVAAVAIVLLAAALFFAVRPLSVMARKETKRKVAAYYHYVNQASQGVQLVKELRVFNVADYFTSRMSGLFWKFRHFRHMAQFLNGLVPAVYQNATVLIVIGGLAVVHFTGVVSVASMGVVVLLLVRSMTYGQALQVVFHTIYEGLPYLELLDEVTARYRANRLTMKGDTLDRIDTLALEQVDFSYHAEDMVLKELSFSVRRGEMIGVVGPSGSGKSTLMQLILRLREPSGGRILVNGAAAESFSRGSWYERVSFVPQEPVLFDETLAECIRFHRPNIGDEQVCSAAKRAGIYDEIMDFAEKLQTRAGERGGNLSGGQRQRICIARALLTNPDIIVFDEPTSALDVHSEAIVLDSLSRLKGRATVFVIAHRLSTLSICDRVMVLRAGRLEAFGPPAALAETNDYYSDSLRLSQLV